MGFRRLLIPAALLCAAVVLSGCDDGDAGSSGETEAATVTFALEGEDFTCDLAPGDADPAAGEVFLELVNDTEEPVAVRIAAADGSEAGQVEVPAAERLNEGFDLEAGEYTVSCTATGQGPGTVDATGSFTVGTD